MVQDAQDLFLLSRTDFGERHRQVKRDRQVVLLRIGPAVDDHEPPGASAHDVGDAAGVGTRGDRPEQRPRQERAKRRFVKEEVARGRRSTADQSVEPSHELSRGCTGTRQDTLRLSAALLRPAKMPNMTSGPTNPAVTPRPIVAYTNSSSGSCRNPPANAPHTAPSAAAT